MSLEYGWGREVFSFSIALQNLMWGALGAVAGGFADRYGPGRVVAIGAICYILGLIGLAYIDTPLLHAPEQRGCCSAARSAAPPSASSSRSSAAPWRRRGAAWRWASPPRPARSASSCCCRSRSPDLEPSTGTTRCSCWPASRRSSSRLSLALVGNPAAGSRREAAVDRRGAARGDGREGLPPAVLGLLRLRLPHRDAHRAPAGVRHRRGPEARRTA